MNILCDFIQSKKYGLFPGSHGFVLNNLALFYKKKQDNLKSYDLYKQALKILELNKCGDYKAIIYSNLCNILTALGEYTLILLIFISHEKAL